MRVFRSGSHLFGRGLLRRMGEAPSGLDQILKKHNATSDDVELAKEEVSVILRKKKVKDRMVVQKIDRTDVEPNITIQEIRNLGKGVEQPKTVEPIEKPAKSIDISRDYLAYSSKLELYLRGMEPKPDTIKYFKYDLPIPNIDPEFRGIEEIANMLSPVPNTPNENLWMQLKELNGDSSYEDFQLAMRSRFNFEMDMYGNEENVPAHQDMMVKFRITFVD